MWKIILSHMLLLILSGVASAEELADPVTQVVQEATDWIARDQGMDPSDIDVRPPDRRATIEACRTDLVFAWPFQNNTRTLEVSCANPQWRYFLQVRSEPQVSVITVTTDLAKGHVLNPEDLMKIQVREAPDDRIDAIEALVGQTLARKVAKGSPILPQDIAAEAMQFRTLRAYERGEVIDRMDLLFESTDRPRAGSLTQWPSGSVATNRALAAGILLSPSDLEAATEVVVAQDNIVRNQVITQSMVAIEMRPERQVRGTPLTRPEEAIGFEATRTLRIGTILSTSDLRAADLIRKGEKVTLTITRGALSISVDTVAMENAKLGEQVVLQNSDSGKEIRGIVTGRHQAKGL